MIILILFICSLFIGIQFPAYIVFPTTDFVAFREIYNAAALKDVIICSSGINMNHGIHQFSG